MLDATLIFFKTGNTIYAVAVVALLIPNMLIGRWVYMT